MKLFFQLLHRPYLPDRFEKITGSLYRTGGKIAMFPALLPDFPFLSDFSGAASACIRPYYGQRHALIV
jgi:hypothetical protein